MEKFIGLGRFYSDFHQQPQSFYANLIGLPFLCLGLLIVLNFFHLIIPQVLNTTLAEIGTIILLAYYIRLNWELGLILTPIFAFLLWISRFIGYQGPSRFAFWSIFIFLVIGLGGCFLFNRQLSKDHFKRILLAPLYLTAEICYKLGFLIKLNDRLHLKQDDLS